MNRLRFLLLFTLLVSSSCKHYSTVTEVQPDFRPRGAISGALRSIPADLFKTLAKDSRNPETAIAGLLEALEISSGELQRDPSNMAAIDAYNFALSRVFSRLRDAKINILEKPLTVSGPDGTWELAGTTSITSEPMAGEIRFIPADQITIGGTYTKERLTKPGLGAPLVAVVPDASQLLKRDPFAQGRRIFYGVTAVARFQGKRCVVSFEDPLQAETTALHNRRFPLAADFTAPLALLLVQENPKKLEIARVFRPDKYAHTARLARLQPYDPKKIPIICVHGLMDSPATWTPLINSLRSDPAIRAKYQFWFFSYPSGYPYPHSAAILRKQLDAFGKKYPGHKEAILIGHSMGGCISQLMIMDPGEKIWTDLFGRPPAETRLSSESHALLSDALVFKKRQDISRVIFIAAPLRGSDLASRWPARLASSLVKSPLSLLKAGQEAIQFATPVSDSLNLHRMPNSVDTMSPKNRFVQAINKLKPATDIPYHVIAGDRGKGGNPDRTKPMKSDGFVPYWSSHMPDAQSELIVPSNHSAHQNPQAIAEINRILKLHAN